VLEVVHVVDGEGAEGGESFPNSLMVCTAVALVVASDGRTRHSTTNHSNFRMDVSP